MESSGRRGRIPQRRALPVCEQISPNTFALWKQSALASLLERPTPGRRFRVRLPGCGHAVGLIWPTQASARFHFHLGSGCPGCRQAERAWAQQLQDVSSNSTDEEVERPGPGREPTLLGNVTIELQAPIGSVPIASASARVGKEPQQLHLEGSVVHSTLHVVEPTSNGEQPTVESQAHDAHRDAQAPSFFQQGMTFSSSIAASSIAADLANGVSSLPSLEMVHLRTGASSLTSSDSAGSSGNGAHDCVSFIEGTATRCYDHTPISPCCVGAFSPLVTGSLPPVQDGAPIALDQLDELCFDRIISALAAMLVTAPGSREARVPTAAALCRVSRRVYQSVAPILARMRMAHAQRAEEMRCVWERLGCTLSVEGMRRLRAWTAGYIDEDQLSGTFCFLARPQYSAVPLLSLPVSSTSVASGATQQAMMSEGHWTTHTALANDVAGNRSVWRRERGPLSDLRGGHDLASLQLLTPYHRPALVRRARCYSCSSKFSPDSLLLVPDPYAGDEDDETAEQDAADARGLSPTGSYSSSASIRGGDNDLDFPVVAERFSRDLSRSQHDVRQSRECRWSSEKSRPRPGIPVMDKACGVSTMTSSTEVGTSSSSAHSASASHLSADSRSAVYSSSLAGSSDSGSITVSVTTLNTCDAPSGIDSANRSAGASSDTSEELNSSGDVSALGTSEGCGSDGGSGSEQQDARCEGSEGCSSEDGSGVGEARLAKPPKGVGVGCKEGLEANTRPFSSEQQFADGGSDGGSSGSEGGGSGGGSEGGGCSAGGASGDSSGGGSSGNVSSLCMPSSISSASTGFSTPSFASTDDSHGSTTTRATHSSTAPPFAPLNATGLGTAVAAARQTTSRRELPMILQCGRCFRRCRGLPVPDDGRIKVPPLAKLSEFEPSTVEAAEALAVLVESGYAFSSALDTPLDEPLPFHLIFDDASCVVLADVLAAGFGSHILSIDLSCDANVGDAGLCALAAALPVCDSLRYFALCGSPAADAGVTALAVALRSLRRGVASADTDANRNNLGGMRDDSPSEVHDAAIAASLAALSFEEADTATPDTDLALPRLKYLQLELPNLRSAGVAALAHSLACGGAPKLRQLWCCGAFSDGYSYGFDEIVKVCDARQIRLELEGVLSPLATTGQSQA